MKKADYLPPEAEFLTIEIGHVVMASIEPSRNGYGTGDDNFTAPGEDIFE